MHGHPIVGAIVNLNHPDHYIHWGFILISAANFIVIVVLVVLFVLAISVPFLKGKPIKRKSYQPAPTDADEEAPGGWTSRGRRLGLKYLPPDKLLPDGQPSYVSSWVYVFGVLTIGALIVAILSGMVLALEGPTWWHVSNVGLFVNSLHLWSVELFMGFMTVHLWAKFWMAAWRGKRWLTWMTGVLAFLVSIVEAFTGYLSQTNFDSQWIAFESKDAFNSGGIGAFFNAMNFGQALMLHIVVVPIVLVLIVGIHVLMVRIRGVVPPIGAEAAHLGVDGDNSTAAVTLDQGNGTKGNAMEVGQ
ncbi:cytochrome b N-terminal domain-containing protein [Ferrimicrobium acidiphilum]|uniref:cytochrome b N-terminal domain-containing protein n=1 Tax=Ferrimicrobium acidiphilum TaxID=121039 RepID=UPI0023F4B5A4|nr:cytochrome b N-terminal domain-containing protein [Ferrimicrobium acidiphilum]